MSSATYQDVVRAIIGREQELMGETALRQASTVSGIDYGDRLEISDSVDRDTVEELMEKYQALQGKASAGLARTVLKDIIDEDTDLDLPESILPEKAKT